MEKALYYPFISVPNNSWLVQGLLYWDGVATIIPESELRSLKYVTPFAKDLIQNGIIDTVMPEEYAFEKPDSYLDFLRWVENNRSRFLVQKRSSNLQRVHAGKLVHVGKLGYLGDEFVKLGVARRENGSWYMLNKDLAFNFMTFLAVLIGQETGRVPSTDQYSGLACLINKDVEVKNNQFENYRDRFRGQLLDRLLPTPRSVKNYYDIIRFKDKYGDQLISFRRKVETFLTSLSPYSVDEQEQLCKSFLENAMKEIQEIKREMRLFGFNYIGLDTLIAATPALYMLHQGDVIGGEVGIASVIGHLLCTYHKRVKSELNKPFAYGAIYGRNHASILRGN